MMKRKVADSIPHKNTLHYFFNKAREAENKTVISDDEDCRVIKCVKPESKKDANPELNILYNDKNRNESAFLVRDAKMPSKLGLRRKKSNTQSLTSAVTASDLRRESLTKQFETVEAQCGIAEESKEAQPLRETLDSHLSRAPSLSLKLLDSQEIYPSSLDESDKNSSVLSEDLELDVTLMAPRPKEVVGDADVISVTNSEQSSEESSEDVFSPSKKAKLISSLPAKTGLKPDKNNAGKSRRREYCIQRKTSEYSEQTLMTSASVRKRDGGSAKGKTTSPSSSIQTPKRAQIFQCIMQNSRSKTKCPETVLVNKIQSRVHTEQSARSSKSDSPSSGGSLKFSKRKAESSKWRSKNTNLSPNKVKRNLLFNKSGRTKKSKASSTNEDEVHACAQKSIVSMGTEKAEVEFLESVVIRGESGAQNMPMTLELCPSMFDEPMTSDSDLENTMSILDDSNTYSPTKLAADAEDSHTLVPYYLANVKVAMEEVLLKSDDRRYFNAADIGHYARFLSCKVRSQMLYIRMLFRRYDWIPKKRLSYKEIPNISEPIDELQEKKFVQDNTIDMSLESMLGMLPVPQLKKICKDMKLPDSLSRQLLIQSMLKHSGEKNVSRMLNTNLTTEQVMIKRVRKEFPLCYKLLEEPRNVFLRIIMLFSLVYENHTARNEQTTAELSYTMLREKLGQIKYPDVLLNRQAEIFMDREHVLRRLQAQDLEEILEDLTHKKRFEEALSHVTKAKQLYDSCIEDAALTAHDERLPSYLRRYTCTSQIIKCMSRSAEVCEKLREWQQAADLYRLILNQQIYAKESRGWWYDRLALIYDFHLKDKVKAVAVLDEALHDDNVRVGFRLSIYQRVERLRASKQFSSLASSLRSVTHESIIPAPQTEITRLGVTGTIPDSNRVNVFLKATANGVVQSKVEDVALDHYMKKYKLDRGMHRESDVFTTMFGFLFWDIIYKPGIPDTFYSKYQHQPLDFQTDQFYWRRKRDIDERLEVVRDATSQELMSLIGPVWKLHFNECSVCVSWDVFHSAQDALGLMLCIGTKLLGDICERLVRGYRFCRSGFPDLTMWNAASKKYKIVEVKGPSDKLSTKQILWLDHFMRRGADVEVCHVKVDKNKR